MENVVDVGGPVKGGEDEDEVCDEEECSVALLGDVFGRGGRREG